MRPALDEIASGVDAVGALGGKPSGTVRITATKHAVSSVVMPVLPGFLASHPDIRVDVIIDDNLTDIVADRIDAGIRFGDIVEKDMIAIRIGPDIRMAVVGAPSYFADHPAPRSPANCPAIAASITGTSGQAGSTPGTSRTRGAPLRFGSMVLLCLTTLISSGTQPCQAKARVRLR